MSLNDLARAGERALDEKYHYGMSALNDFGSDAAIAGTVFILEKLHEGERDIEVLADAAHRGWALVVKSINDPIYTLRPDKKEDRLKLADIPYSELSEEEKEKDRIVAKFVAQEFKRSQ